MNSRIREKYINAGHRGPRIAPSPAQPPRLRTISPDTGRPVDRVVAALLGLLPQLRNAAQMGRRECRDNGALVVVLDESCTEAFAAYCPEDRLDVLFATYADPQMKQAYQGFEQAGATLDRQQIVTFARLQHSDGSAKNMTMMLRLV